MKNGLSTQLDEMRGSGQNQSHVGRCGEIISLSVFAGLHHRYERKLPIGILTSDKRLLGHTYPYCSSMRCNVRPILYRESICMICRFANDPCYCC